MSREQLPFILGESTGQSQADRFAAALEPDFARVEERSLVDHADFAARFAELIRYFDPDTGNVSGNWQPFFEELAGQLAALPRAPGSLPPHAALLVAFLRLMRHGKRHLNSFTGRHLDFYLRRVLRLAPRPPVPDRVHLLFELKKDGKRLELAAGTRFTAGKDAAGRELFFALEEAWPVGHAVVDGLKAIRTDQEGTNKVVRMAPLADSADGLGAELPKESPAWPPFGHAGLPQARLGTALASELLRLAEGERTITARFILAETAVLPPAAALEAHLTGAKGWLAPKPVKLSRDSDANGRPRLTLIVELAAEDEAVCDYDPEVHGGSFDAAAPLLQVVLKEGSSRYDYAAFETLALAAVRLEVRASGLSQLTLASDLGDLDPNKPFLPFGPAPEKGATLTIGCKEALSKRLTELSLTIDWHQVPARNLGTYHAYPGVTISGNSAFTADLLAAGPTGWPDARARALFDATDARSRHTITFRRGAPAAAGKPLGPSRRMALLGRQQTAWAKGRREALQLLDHKAKGLARAAGRRPALAAAGAGLAKDTVGLRLNRGFLHRAYQKAYTQAVIDFARHGKKGDTLSLPPEPYTPAMAALSLGYRAESPEVDLTATGEDDFLAAEVALFHVTAFGQRREHAFLKDRLGFAADRRVMLMPDCPHAGELYIGIRQAAPLEAVSLLVQTLEGSANPERQQEPLSWSVLCDNHWRPLTDTELVRDTTNGLLVSGIVTVSIPAAATADNTLLPAGRHWLRAAISQHDDAVCRLLAVAANGGVARFVDQGNDPADRPAVLAAGSIAKPVGQIAGLKGVSQPYASFGGRPAEDDRAFAVRASERLRHKGRAVSAWDYERLVLALFPRIYKARCLPHTAPDRAEAPGHVTVVVIPDCRSGNAFDPLAPKADLNTLAAVAELLGQLSGKGVTPHVVNPHYEAITADFKVRFRQGCDFGLEKERLDRALRQFLSPWAFESDQGPRFGGRLPKSQLVSFLEERLQVEYVTDVKLYQHPYGSPPAAGRQVETAEALDPRAILVSAASHAIAPA